MVCLPVIMFNNFYGFASTGFILVFVSYRLSDYCRTCESFCSICVQGALPILSRQQFLILYYFILLFHIPGYVFKM